MQPSDIYFSARRWVGTRFKHQGRLCRTSTHHGGVDYLGLLIGVATDLSLKSRSGELLASLDNPTYPRIPDGQTLKATLSEHLHEIPISAAAPGDIALITFDHNPQHLAILSSLDNTTGIIHSYMEARGVVETHYATPWISRTTAIFRLPCLMINE